MSILLERNPAPETLAELGVKSWPVWGCEASSFPWTYDCAETCYLLEGEVTVTPEGGEPVDVKGGDLVTFAAGLSCVWTIRQAVRKHYNFG